MSDAGNVSGAQYAEPEPESEAEAALPSTAPAVDVPVYASIDRPDPVPETPQVPTLAEFLSDLTEDAAGVEASIRENGFDSLPGVVAAKLTEADLKDLGITKMRERKAVFHALRTAAKAEKRRLQPRPPVRSADAKVRAWNDGHRKPSRRPEAPMPTDSLAFAEVAVRKSVKALQSYQTPWMSLATALGDGDSGLMSGQGVSGTITREWFNLQLQSVFRLALEQEQADALFDKYADEEGGDTLSYRQFARVLFGAAPGATSPRGGSATDRRRRARPPPASSPRRGSRSSRPSSAPSGGDGPQLRFPAHRRTFLQAAEGRGSTNNGRATREALLRQHRDFMRASSLRRQAVSDRAGSGRRSVDNVKLVRRRRASHDATARQSAEMRLISQEDRLAAAAARREQQLHVRASSAGRGVSSCDKEGNSRLSHEQMKTVKKAHKRYKENLNLWNQVASMEEEALCTYQPAIGGKVRYSHVSPRGRMDNRKSLAERTMEAQRARAEMLRERRAHEIELKKNSARRGAKVSIVPTHPSVASTPISHAFRKGAFKSDEPTSWAFEGTIKYRHCRQGIMVPSFWPKVAKKTCERSREKPDIWLQLEHVFGYNGPKNIQANVFFTASGEVLYYTSAVGVLYNPKDNTQRFYIGHEDEISCLALHPNLDIVATGGTGKVPKIQIWSAATMKGPELEEVEGTRHELELMPGDQYVVCMAFSPDGNLLLTISANEDHTIRIWDWKTKKMIENAETKGNKGIAPQEYGAVWNKYRGNKSYNQDKHHFDFVTFGAKHLVFWTFTAGGEPVLAKKDASYGEIGTRQSVWHACFLPTGQLLSGGDNGKIMIWEKNKAVREVDAHNKGPLKCMRLRADEKTLLSSGADGQVLRWNIEVVLSDDDLAGLGEEIKTQDIEITKRQLELVKNVVRVMDQAVAAGRQLFEKPFSTREELFNAMDQDGDNNLNKDEFRISVDRLGFGLTEDQVGLLWQIIDPGGDGELDFDEFKKLFTLQGLLETVINSDAIELTIKERFDLDVEKDPDGPQCVNCIDCHPDHDFFVGADSENDIWEIDANPRVMVEGQSGHVFGLSPHPQLSRVYATACADGHIGVWDAESRTNVKMIRVERGLLTSKQQKLGLKEGEHLQAWACTFSSDGTMLAVSTAGVVDDEERTHPDTGGSLIVYQCVEEMFTPSEDPADKMFNPTKLFEVKDMETVIDDLKFSPDGKFLATCSHDRCVDIYGIGAEVSPPAFVHVGRCKGHSSTVVSLDWSDDSRLLRSCSVDNELMHWNTSGKLVLEEVRDAGWDTWTCKVGFAVMGIWGKGMNSSEINYCYRSHNKKWIVAADHEGLVRLSNFPAVIQHAPCFAHRGHASHIERVCFLSDDSRVISCGGADMATYQWKVRGPGKPKAKDKLKDLMSARGTAAAFGGDMQSLKDLAAQGAE